MRTILLGTAWGWLTFTAVRLFAAEVLPPILTNTLPDYVVTTWQMQDGLPSERVRTVLQTRDGYIWVATFNGAAQFDGVRFRVFNEANTPPLRNRVISCLFEDAAGRLWFGSDTGEITWRDEIGFHALAVTNNWPISPIARFAEGADGNLWVLSHAGFILRLRNLIVEGALGEAGGPLYSDVVTDAQGQVWAVRFGGALTRLIGGGAILAGDMPQPPRVYRTVATARSGGLWLREGERLRRWSQGKWIEDRGRHTWGARQAVVLYEAPDGEVWVGTRDAGAFRVAADGSEYRIHQATGLAHDWVSSITEDWEGNLWLGSNGGGVGLLRRRALFMVNSPDEWQHRAIMSVAPAVDGGLWIGTEGAGVYRLQGGEFIRLNTNNSPVGRDIRALAQDRAGRLWACADVRERLDSGLLVLGQLGKLSIGAQAPGLLSSEDGQLHPVVRANTHIEMPFYYYALYPSRSGAMWMGSQNGLVCLQQDQWSRLGTDLYRPQVHCITETPDGALWVGMRGGGVARYQGGKFTQFLRAQGLPEEDVCALLGDADGTVWIGTPGAGLVRWRGGRFDQFTTRHGLPSDFICNIQADRHGHLWIGSYAGIFKVGKVELDRCARGETASVNCFVLDTSDGLASLEMASGSQPSACTTGDGRLWFATSRGLAMVDPARIRTNSLPPPVLLEEVLVDGRPLPLPWPVGAASDGGIGAGFEIPPGSGQIELRYTALSFCSPHRVRFRYRLEKLDARWLEAGTRRAVYYSHLAPGEYVFRVIGCNNDGVWNEMGAAVALLVLPYFWQTWWFAPLCWGGGVCLAGTGVIIRFRRRQRVRIESLERARMVERERGRIARDLHDDLGSGLTDISTTSAICQDASLPADEARVYLHEISQRANDMVNALDEIVWAVNPRHDDLGSLALYFSQFAERFVRGTPVRCRFEVPERLPPLPLNAEQRHSLFLAFKEAIQNTVIHAGASSLRVNIAVENDTLRITLEDDGCGFDAGAAEPGADGLRNMRERLGQLGGRCEIVTAPGQGARVIFHVPIKGNRKARQ